MGRNSHSADAVGVGTPSPGPCREPQRLEHLPPSPVSVVGRVLPRGTIDNLPLRAQTPRAFRQTSSSLWTKGGLPRVSANAALNFLRCLQSYLNLILTETLRQAQQVSIPILQMRKPGLRKFQAFV